MQTTDHPPIRHAAAHRIRYRARGTGDMAFLSRLYRSTRDEEMAATGWSEDEKAAFIAMQFKAQHAHYTRHYRDALWLVIEQDGGPIGRLYLERWETEHRIIDIALMPAHRGMGIGRAILRDLQDDARAAGGKHLGIHVEKTNPAKALYQRLGFRVVEDKGVYDLLRWSGDDSAAGGQANTAS